MASNVPTKAGFTRKARLVWLAVFDPTTFDVEEAKDNAFLNNQADRDAASPIHRVRTALWEALLWCLVAVLIGLAAGWSASTFLGKQPFAAVTAIILGTAVLLWATLALQVWDIQSIGGVRLSERVNRWIFRCLYAFGTFLIVFGSLWATA